VTGALEHYHGLVLARLVRATQPVRIGCVSRSAYVIDDAVGLYIKYSTNRMSPWPFSFSRAHQEELEGLAASYEETFIALVCGTDGIACLGRGELSRVLDDEYREVEWVKASRRPREKYAIRGSDDRRGFKVGDNEFPAKVLGAAKRLSP
jgi:hypothetical protein